MGTNEELQYMLEAALYRVACGLSNVEDARLLAYALGLYFKE